MTKWEYARMNWGVFSKEGIDAGMDRYGEAGWELVTVLDVEDGYEAFFKRPLS